MKKTILAALCAIVFTGCSTTKYCVDQSKEDGCSLFSTYGCNAPVPEHDVNVKTR